MATMHDKAASTKKFLCCTGNDFSKVNLNIQYLEDWYATPSIPNVLGYSIFTCNEACLTHLDLLLDVTLVLVSVASVMAISGAVVSTMLINSSSSSLLSMEVSLNDTRRILTGLGGTIRKGIPAKFSLTFASGSKSLESPLILRKLWEGDIFGVGWITLMSIWSVSPELFWFLSDILTGLTFAWVSTGPWTDSWHVGGAGMAAMVGDFCSFTRCVELLEEDSFSWGIMPFTATINECLTALGK